jgi:ABC-type multidrug transport system fused ATPase/permease subunit
VEWRDEREEAPATIAPRPPPSWPHAGGITAVQLRVAYRPDLPPVIDGLSFEVAPGEKVGICGRTGGWLFAGCDFQPSYEFWE